MNASMERAIYYVSLILILNINSCFDGKKLNKIIDNMETKCQK